MRAIGLLPLLAVLCAVILVEASRGRQRPLLGGWRPININGPEAQEAARKATVHLEQMRNSMRAYRLHRLISAKSQVVAGKNYRLELIIAQTDCNRGQTGQNVNLDNCSTVKIQRCNATIHVPLQSESSRLMNQSCGRERTFEARPARTTRRPPLVGGHTEINVSSDEVRQAATFATEQLTSQSNGRYRVQHQRIIRATSQIVAGVMYTLTMEVSLTESGTNEIKSTQCEVKVWDQPWRTPRYQLHEYKCNEFIV